MTPHLTHDVLLVDPEDDVRCNLALYLRMHGCRVTGARGPDDTLQHLRFGFRPCVVLTDPRATGTAGWELVDYLRADSVLATVPLILATVDALQLKCARWHGVRESIAKPAEPSRFVDVVERQCRRQWRRLERLVVPAALAPGPVIPLSRRHHDPDPAYELPSSSARAGAGARAAGAFRR
jgi:DNA-binding NtrC family response regulator